MERNGLKRCPWCEQTMCVCGDEENGYYVTATMSLRSCVHMSHVMYPSAREAVSAWNDGTTIKEVKKRLQNAAK